MAIYTGTVKEMIKRLKRFNPDKLLAIRLLDTETGKWHVVSSKLFDLHNEKPEDFETDKDTINETKNTVMIDIELFNT